MNKKFFILIITSILLIFSIKFLRNPQIKTNLISPIYHVIPIVTVTPTAIPTPQTYNFNSTTDLKKELDLVSPEILDSDFQVAK